MPINEASRKPPRPDWPLEFDLTGVPRDTKIRKGLIIERQEQQMVQNSFAVDKPVVAISDINNPPKVNYNPNDPKNEFPKMVYHHDTGRVLTVSSQKEEKAALKRGFNLKPAAGRDYSRVSRAGIAAPAAAGEKREEELSAEELAALDAE